MQIQVIDNISRTMLSVLPALIERSRDVRIAVAFLSRSGLGAIEAPVKAMRSKGANLEFLVGLDLQGTEPEAVRALHTWSLDGPGISLYCYASRKAASIYHPKVYLFRGRDETTAIIGSSNLTIGGLRSNIEANVAITAEGDNEVLDDVYSTYTRLKFQPERVAPDVELLDLYTELCARARTRAEASDKAERAVTRRFLEKARSLTRPVPTQRDLAGWLRLVYEALPDGTFTTRQVYEYERSFADRYPQNLNIRAKIRQQLQVLRDMGLIEHVGHATWRKRVTETVLR